VATLPLPAHGATHGGVLDLATIVVFLIVGEGELPFGERPSLEGVLHAWEVINGWANVGVALIFIGVTYLVIKGRAGPDMVARAPARSAALTETVGCAVSLSTVSLSIEKYLVS
jgi:hypothetical protein